MFFYLLKNESAIFNLLQSSSKFSKGLGLSSYYYQQCLTQISRLNWEELQTVERTLYSDYWGFTCEVIALFFSH